ncbi:claw keratin-like, partial [Chelydra serpentina]
MSRPLRLRLAPKSPTLRKPALPKGGFSKVYLHPRKMTFSSLGYPECGVARPSPVTGSCNEPCVRQCPDSEVVI